MVFAGQSIGLAGRTDVKVSAAMTDVVGGTAIEYRNGEDRGVRLTHGWLMLHGMCILT